MNKQEILQHIRKEVEYTEGWLSAATYDTSRSHGRGAIEAYLDIYNKIMGNSEINEDDKEWADNVISKLQS